MSLCLAMFTPLSFVLGYGLVKYIFFTDPKKKFMNILIQSIDVYRLPFPSFNLFDNFEYYSGLHEAAVLVCYQRSQCSARSIYNLSSFFGFMFVFLFKKHPHTLLLINDKKDHKLF